MAAEALAVVDTLLRDDEASSPTALAYALTQSRRIPCAHGDSITAAHILARARAWIATHKRASPSSNQQLVEGMVFWESGAPDSAVARLTLAARDTSRIEAAGYLACWRGSRAAIACAKCAVLPVADSLGGVEAAVDVRRQQHSGARQSPRRARRSADRAVQLLLQAAHRSGSRWTRGIHLPRFSRYMVIRPSRRSFVQRSDDPEQTWASHRSCGRSVFASLSTALCS